MPCPGVGHESARMFARPSGGLSASKRDALLSEYRIDPFPGVIYWIKGLADKQQCRAHSDIPSCYLQIIWALFKNTDACQPSLALYMGSI